MGVCFEYPLDQAIGEFLTPYRYFPIPTMVTSNENDEYEDLSRSIATLASRDVEHDTEVWERLKKLLMRRAQIVSAAENKIPLLLSALKKQMFKSENRTGELRDVLIYCAPGTHKKVLGAVS